MKVKLAFLALAITAFSGGSSPVRAQGFPWQEFERRTLKEIVAINESEDAEDRKRLPNQNRMIMRGKILSSAVRVTYVGESRFIGDERKKFIELWAGSYFSQTPGYASRYESEFLFKEANDEYWLPVQKQVASYFSKELQKGDTVDLYLIRPGGLSIKGKIDWVFLVEEFLKPKE